MVFAAAKLSAVGGAAGFLNAAELDCRYPSRLVRSGFSRVPA
jgi:hypothetical protein